MNSIPEAEKKTKRQLRTEAKKLVIAMCRDTLANPSEKSDEQIEDEAIEEVKRIRGLI